MDIEKNLIGRIIFKKYLIKNLLGEGTFSKVFLGENIINNKSYAIKSENIFSKKIFLKDEAFKLYNLKGFGIPEVITFGRSGNYRFLVQTLLGKSLKEIWIEKKNKLYLKDICLIAKQTLDRIEFIHSKNYIHRDIKPANFLVGNPDNSIIYLIDFGNARKFRSSKTGKHIRPFKINRIFGTYLFLSTNASEGFQQSRRDDLESLGYMYILLAKGELPWSRLKCLNKGALFYNALQLKKSILMENLCEDLPNEFCEYMKYVKKLNFESIPDYEYLRSLFKNMLYSIDMFSWMDNNLLTVDDYKEKNSLARIRITKGNHIFKKNYFNKKNKILTDLNYFNTDKENIEEYKHKKIIFNKKNINDDKKQRQFSVNMTNSIEIEGIKCKSNNMNYFQNINIFNNSTINKTERKTVDKYKLIKFPKLKEYTPRFSAFYHNDFKNTIKNLFIDKNNDKNIYFKKLNNSNNKNINTNFKNYINNKQTQTIKINNLSNNTFERNSENNISKKSGFPARSLIYSIKANNDFLKKYKLNVINKNSNKKNENKHLKNYTFTSNH